MTTNAPSTTPEDRPNANEPTDAQAIAALKTLIQWDPGRRCGLPAAQSNHVRAAWLELTDALVRFVCELGRDDPDQRSAETP